MMEGSVFECPVEGAQRGLLYVVEGRLVVFQQKGDSIVGNAISEGQYDHSDMGEDDVVIANVWWYDGTEPVDVAQAEYEQLFCILQSVTRMTVRPQGCTLSEAYRQDPQGWAHFVKEAIDSTSHMQPLPS